MAKIFIIDDDITLQEMLTTHLQRSGHHTDCAATLAEGMRQVAAGNYDVIFLDVQLPDGNGLDSMAELKTAASSPEVIIITGKGDVDGAEKAITSGAWAYIEKPNVIRELLLHLTRALQYRREKHRKITIPMVLRRDHIVGSSSLLTTCLDHVAQAASSDASVLITGETGTGKELFAKAINENSRRAAGNFITVDCAALPETLIESTLFGHEKGAFTGAESSREGLVQLADSGTLFLDEIGELPLQIQKKFLRLLQEHVFRPVGSTQEKRSDFRVIAATNVDIHSCVARGSFRKDLLYRLNAFSCSPPPLRKRKEDIKALVRYFLAQICDRSNIQCKGIDPDFIAHLMSYDWPGNIRELQQTLEQVVACAVGVPTLFANHLPEHFRINHAKSRMKPAGSPAAFIPMASVAPVPLSWQEHKQNCEQQYIKNLMQHTEGNITLACSISKLSRTRLYQLREKYGLTESS